MVYGHRARIGYTSPAATEVFPYEFYLAAPEGVTLVLTTLAIVDSGSDEVNRSYEISVKAAKEMAGGADLIVFGGCPSTCRAASTRRCAHSRDGSRSRREGHDQSQFADGWLHAVGAKRSPLHPFDETISVRSGCFCGRLEGAGLEYVAVPARVQGGSTWDAFRSKRHSSSAGKSCAIPEADTILVSCPHWAVSKSIDAMERELGRPVVTSSQSITWNALRLYGIEDRSDGHGRLLREH